MAEQRVYALAVCRWMRCCDQAGVLRVDWARGERAREEGQSVSDSEQGTRDATQEQEQAQPKEAVRALDTELQDALHSILIGRTRWGLAALQASLYLSGNSLGGAAPALCTTYATTTTLPFALPVLSLSNASRTCPISNVESIGI